MSSLLSKFQSAKHALTTYNMGLLQAKAYRVLNTHTALALREFNISPIEWAFLGLLFEQNEKLQLAEAAKELGVEAPFVTELARGLEKKGLITRTHSPKDKRVKFIFLTTEGEKFIPKVESHLRNQTRALLKGASIGKILGYRTVLKIIVDNWESNNKKN